ncbi:MAG: hypothetical protein DSY37_00140 [Hyperthermus sp.]|nr:MAG: hypothetical protein DSY37_00140 [Hyperthermus sp.]
MIFRRKTPSPPPEEKKEEEARRLEAPPKEGFKSVEDYIRWAIANSVLIQRDVLVDLYSGFEKVMRFVGGLLYSSAKNAGKLTAERLVEQGFLNEDNVADVMFQSFVVAGYAEKLRVASVTLEKKKTIIEVEGEGLLLGSRLKKKGNVDQPLAGFMAGWLEAFYKVKTNARETACQARGDPSCRFRIEVGDAREELKRLEGKVYERGQWLKLLSPAEAPAESPRA